MNKHKGKTVEEWIDVLQKKILELETFVKTNDNQMNMKASQIPFNSPKFKSKNVADALNESRGLVLGQFDLLSADYNESLNVREALDTLFIEHLYPYNKELFTELADDIQKPKTHREALDILFKLIVRITLDLNHTRGELEDLQEKFNKRNHVKRSLATGNIHE